MLQFVAIIRFATHFATQKRNKKREANKYMKGERVAQLELILRGHPEGLRKSDIARRLGVHRSTIGRYIDELKQYSDIYEDKNLVKILPKEEKNL